MLENNIKFVTELLSLFATKSVPNIDNPTLFALIAIPDEDCIREDIRKAVDILQRECYTEFGCDRIMITGSTQCAKLRLNMRDAVKISLLLLQPVEYSSTMQEALKMSEDPEAILATALAFYNAFRAHTNKQAASKLKELANDLESNLDYKARALLFANKVEDELLQKVNDLEDQLRSLDYEC